MRGDFVRYDLWRRMETPGKRKLLGQIQMNRYISVKVLGLNRDSGYLGNENGRAKYARDRGISRAFLPPRLQTLVLASRRSTGAHSRQYRRAAVREASTPNAEGKKKGKTKNCRLVYQTNHRPHRYSL